MKLRVLCLLMSLAALMCGCGVKNTVSGNDSSAVSSSATSEEETTNAEKAISIACSVTDSFCPYTAETAINREAALLLYDSLIRLDNSFTPYNCIADEVEKGEKTLTVTLKSITFTDGTALTADDVVYCANKAKKSDTKYKDRLSGITVSAASSNTVVFTGENKDPYMVNRLDFPIYKANSDKKSSSDKIEIPPIGSGRYVVNSEKTAFVANPDHYDKVTVKKINIVNTPDNDALSHNLEIGNISCYYSDLADCTLSQVRGGYEKVNLTNLVYLGVNMKSGAFSNVEMRQAVSAVIDREKISDSAFYQNAVAANGIFHPYWKAAPETVSDNSSETNTNVYLAQLAKIGYNKKDSKGYFVNSQNERLTLKLVCYNGNEWRCGAAKLIKTQLNSAGIAVKLEELDWGEYKSALKNGYFDMYLAEVKLGNNMDISEIVTKGGSAAYGIYYKKLPKAVKAASSVSDTASAAKDTASKADEDKKDYAGSTAAAVKNFYSGKAELLQIADAFNSEMPVIPVCWRTGIVSFGDGIAVSSPSAGDVYGSIKQ